MIRFSGNINKYIRIQYNTWLPDNTTHRVQIQLLPSTTI
jgi:hypothetical protein